MQNLKTLPIVLLLSLGTVAACGSDKDDAKDDPACTSYESGKASDSVKVSGDFGEKKPKATFDTPVSVKKDELQRTVLDKGDGKKTAKGDQVDAVISIFNGRTGKETLSEKLPATVSDEGLIEAFRAGLECVPVGSRVVTAVKASDVYGEGGAEEFDLKADDALVIVTDVIGPHVDVKATPWTKDVPKVSFDKAGEPKVTLPKVDPPKDVLVKVLKEGDGEVVKAGDTVKARYQGSTWEEKGKVFESTFAKDAEQRPMNLTQMVEGFRVGLVGQKVGTRLMVSMPPEYGFGTKEDAPDHPLGGKTLLFVVEISSIEK